MKDQSLLKALFPGATLTFLLVTCTVMVFLPVIIGRLVWLIVADTINKIKTKN